MYEAEDKAIADQASKKKASASAPSDPYHGSGYGAKLVQKGGRGGYVAYRQGHTGGRGNGWDISKHQNTQLERERPVRDRIAGLLAFAKRRIKEHNQVRKRERREGEREKREGEGRECERR